MPEQLGVFLYGTLRPGGWNHDEWLVPFLARPCRPAALSGYALHRQLGLPCIVPALAGSLVVGDIADLVSDRYEEALAHLDVLENTAGDDYRRVTVTAVGGEQVWVWVAGPVLAASLGPGTLVEHGDWLQVPGAA